MSNQQPNTFILITTVLILTVNNVDSQNYGLNKECIITKYSQVSFATRNCKEIIIDNLKVPPGKQLDLKLNPGTNLTFKGIISFGYAEWAGPLVVVTGSNLSISGEQGVIDGQGALWWDGKGSWGEIVKPRVFKFTNVDNSIIEDINLINCPQACVSIRSSENLTIRNWIIDILDGDEGVAPKNKFGHNTDGFGIGSHSKNILIENSVIYNQDDCVAISSGSDITVRNLFCHGSHGLSISIAGGFIENVLFSDSMMINGENGIHVKTHVDGQYGMLLNVTYRNITILDAKNYGINIQQNYKNLPAGQPQDSPPSDKILIHELKLIDIRGDVQYGAIPVYILCAKDGCYDWRWKNVNLYGARHDNCTNYEPYGYECY